MWCSNAEWIHFSDTIERNIATNDIDVDPKKLANAVNIANIKSFIEELPLGFKTKITLPKRYFGGQIQTNSDS